MNFVAGQFLLWAGFLSGALATVFNIENADNPWSTINWFWYVASLIAGVVGVVLIRQSLKKTGHDEHTQASLKVIKGHLANLVTNTRSLLEQQATPNPRATLEFIDEVLADDFREFAEGRDSISREYGLETFAEVMTEFAAGERAINRAWSASADGYVNEATACIQRGLERLEAAEAALLDKAV